MSDLLKRGFLLGLGAAVLGKESLKKKLDEMVANDELTVKQAREMLRKFTERGESKAAEWSEQQDEQKNKIIDELGIATKEELKELEVRLQQLENVHYKGEEQ
ncbi:phasin family protein [Sediminibacillus halophilus]|uniref:Polyhydroxyalkanoate synthesis regulator phasin n=1 Tax=Sediminibacillus halophilus TaxID=482461 RepID=A0A1G9TUV5_9BACI|nr:hypothetical protein [Sediminibacillus halophilus]SDM51368.1 Polyhydroxyalkanoate synthesis regulator phasin [Sediminibacillus halophilus]